MDQKKRAAAPDLGILHDHEYRVDLNGDNALAYVVELAGTGKKILELGAGSGMLTTTRRVSAVTGACILTRRDVFEALGGLDEDFVVECNDIDYCLRAGAAGLAVVCAATPTLVHKEGSTRHARPLRAQEARDCALFVKRWGRALVDDPYYPPELTLSNESLAFADEPRHAS